MITLGLRDCFEVGLASVAYDTGRPPALLTGCHAQIVVPRPGGSPLVFASLIGSGPGHVLIDFSQDGAPAAPAFDGQYMQGFCSFEGGILAFDDTGHVAYHEAGQRPRRIVVDNPFEPARRLLPAYRLIAEGGRVAVPLRDGVDAALAVLNVGLHDGHAQWIAFGDGPISLVLDPPDFPANFGKSVYFERAIIRNGEIIVHSQGQFGQPRTGYRFAVVARIGTCGGVTKRIFWQDYNAFQDEKKRGFIGEFTQSRDYFIAKGCYRSTDIWKGKTVAIELETGEAVPFKLPKGHTDVRIIDHIDGQWWGTRTGPDGAMQVMVFDAV